MKVYIVMNCGDVEAVFRSKKNADNYLKKFSGGSFGIGILERVVR